MDFYILYGTMGTYYISILYVPLNIITKVCLINVFKKVKMVL